MNMPEDLIIALIDLEERNKLKADAAHQSNNKREDSVTPHGSLEEGNKVEADAAHQSNNKRGGIIMPNENVDNSLTSSQADTLSSVSEAPASCPSSNTEVQSSATTTVQAPTCSSRAAVVRRLKSVLTCRERIKDLCEEKIVASKLQSAIMRREHEKEMEIKDLKIRILKEKLKYWQGLKCRNVCEEHRLN